MRICLISREYPPDTGWGGVGAYTYQIAHGLHERGNEVHVICLAGDAGQTVDIDEGGVTIHRVAYKHLLDELNLFLVSAPSAHYVVASIIALWRRFVQLHGEKPFDVIEVPEHLAAGVFQSLTGVAPTVVKLHTPHSKFVAEQFHGVLPTFDNQLICLLERVAMLAADALCSPSRDLAGFVAQDLGLSDEQTISIVRNPADLARFNSVGDRALDNSSGPIVLFVGRLEERKGIRYLIDAVPSIHSEFPQARFVIVGADTKTAPGGTSMRAHLEKTLAAVGCAGAVEFKSFVPLDQIATYYRSADICVVPSLYDNAPYTCIEAMSCGRPVVATSAGGTSEYVAHGEMGLVVPPADSVALAEAVCRLLADEHLRKQFGANARRFVESHLDRKEIARQMELIYKNAIADFRNRSNLYQKPANNALHDALELLCSYDAMIFDTLYSQSLDFRIRHWLRFLRKRPTLCLAGLASAALHKLLPNQPAFLRRLDESIAARTPPRYSLTMLLQEEVVNAAPRGAAPLHKPVAASSGRDLP